MNYQFDVSNAESSGESGGVNVPTRHPYNSIPRKNVVNEKKTNDILYKTELCKSVVNGQICSYGSNCLFAHDINGSDLRPRVQHLRYKSVLCTNFHTKKFCPFKARCTYVHDDFRIANTTTNEVLLLSASDNLVRIESNAPVNAVPGLPSMIFNSSGEMIKFVEKEPDGHLELSPTPSENADDITTSEKTTDSSSEAQNKRLKRTASPRIEVFVVSMSAKKIAKKYGILNIKNIPAGTTFVYDGVDDSNLPITLVVPTENPCEALVNMTTPLESGEDEEDEESTSDNEPSEDHKMVRPNLDAEPFHPTPKNTQHHNPDYRMRKPYHGGPMHGHMPPHPGMMNHMYRKHNPHHMNHYLNAQHRYIFQQQLRTATFYQNGVPINPPMHMMAPPMHIPPPNRYPHKYMNNSNPPYNNRNHNSNQPNNKALMSHPPNYNQPPSSAPKITYAHVVTNSSSA